MQCLSDVRLFLRFYQLENGEQRRLCGTITTASPSVSVVLIMTAAVTVLLL